MPAPEPPEPPTVREKLITALVLVIVVTAVVIGQFR